MSLRGNRATRVAVLSMCALLSGCSKIEVTDATDVVVIVDSDLALKQQLASLHVEVLDEGGKSRASEHDFELSPDDTLPISFGVYQRPDGASWFMLLLRGRDDAGDSIVEYRVISHFEKGKTSHLQVVLSSACAGKFCRDQPELTCESKSGECEEVRRVDPVRGDPGDSGSPVVIGDDGDAGPGGAAGGALDSGESREPDGAAQGQPVVMDAALPTATDPAAPSLGAAATLGVRRTDGTLTVYDDGFELGARVCTVDRQFCVTGSFAP